MRQTSTWKTSLCPWQPGVGFLLACLLLISRRPDALFNAQFAAEDGHTWFADAYNFGWWPALWRTYEGYHHVFMRLGASLALLVPLAAAPLVMNLIAMALEALPVSLLLSPRSSSWGTLRFRALLAAGYLVLPNTQEMLNNISQAQWPLTLCAYLLLVASPPNTLRGKAFDLSILLLCGLSGPQCLFLLPVALALAWREQNRWRWVSVAVLAISCLLQGWPLMHGGLSSRPHSALGASLHGLVRIVASQVFLGTLVGGNGLGASTKPQVFAFLLCSAVVGSVLSVLCLLVSERRLQGFTLLTAFLFAVSLLSPTAYPPAGTTIWQLLERVYGIRYWYLPCLCFTWLLLSGARSQQLLLKAVTRFLLVCMCFGILSNWRVPALPDLRFASTARQFEAAPAGTVMTIPQNPFGWNLQLVRHPAR